MLTLLITLFNTNPSKFEMSATLTCNFAQHSFLLFKISPYQNTPNSRVLVETSSTEPPFYQMSPSLIVKFKSRAMADAARSTGLGNTAASAPGTPALSTLAPRILKYKGVRNDGHMTF